MASSTTNLGPLPPFTAPSSCYDQQGVYFFPSGDLVQGPTDIGACMPSHYVPSRGAYYSASTCPPGFTVACSSLVTSGTVVAETAYTCCQTLLPLTCNPDAATFYASWFTTLGCSTTWVFETSFAVTSVFDGGSTSVGLHTIFSNEGIGAYSVQIRVPNADLATTSADSSSITPTTSSTAGGASAKNTASPTNSPSLTSGAVAGIAVGSALGGILFATVFLLWWMKMKRAQRQRTTVPPAWATAYPEQQPPQNQHQQLHQQQSPQNQYQQQQQNWKPPGDFGFNNNTTPNELASQPPLHEMQVVSSPVELQGSRTTSMDMRSFDNRREIDGCVHVGGIQGI
ncbi:hypothetical protein F4808DRAFT_472453 [Astrocystis sublimbata]|nr:hypothetical protein F4808DRAFT_472453 [Astrocystis sublimbata]